jgi:hypothetical protein
MYRPSRDHAWVVRSAAPSKVAFCSDWNSSRGVGGGGSRPPPGAWNAWSMYSVKRGHAVELP